ncbi:hypothetical protein FJZ18_04365 [Candidatus Pacearchaeota archaeon]|nr:hypothetical protein [Candidatus Pacearchaeota archaeon]
MNKWLELLVGLVLVIGAILVAFYSPLSTSLGLSSAAISVFWGGLFWFIVAIGALFVLLGISDLKG